MRTIYNNFAVITNLNNQPLSINRNYACNTNALSQDKVCFSGITEKSEPSKYSNRNIIVKSPDTCTQKELKDFEKLVSEGKQISTKGLSDRIKDSKALAFFYMRGELASISAIKIPKKSYKEKVFRNAGVAELAAKYPYELGYSYTKPEYRGQGLNMSCSKVLLNDLKSGIYATVRENNAAERHILEKLGFKTEGQPWPGSSGHNIVLYTKS